MCVGYISYVPLVWCRLSCFHLFHYHVCAVDHVSSIPYHYGQLSFRYMYIYIYINMSLFSWFSYMPRSWHSLNIRVLCGLYVLEDRQTVEVGFLVCVSSGGWDRTVYCCCFLMVVFIICFPHPHHSCPCPTHELPPSSHPHHLTFSPTPTPHSPTPFYTHSYLRLVWMGPTSHTCCGFTPILLQAFCSLTHMAAPTPTPTPSPYPTPPHPLALYISLAQLLPPYPLLRGSGLHTLHSCVPMYYPLLLPAFCLCLPDIPSCVPLPFGSHVPITDCQPSLPLPLPAAIYAYLLLPFPMPILHFI